jgi:membrane protein implicated in regulation of membrane protease activity
MRFAATFAIIAVTAWVAFRVVFGIAGGIIGLLLGLALLALKLLLVGGAIYFVLTLVAPDTARKVRERVSGEPGNP